MTIKRAEMRGRYVAAMAAMLLAGCADASDTTSATHPLPDTVVAELLTEIGELEGAPEYLFGDVGAVAAGPNGTIYVADRIGSTVRAYDTSGQFLATVGSAGEGPGEFTRPSDLTFDPSGRLYARDLTRIAVFARSGARAWTDSIVRTTSLGGFYPQSTRARADGSRYFFPSYYYFMFVTHRYFYQVFDSAGATGDTVPVLGIPNPEIFGRANYMVSDDTGRPVEGINTAPFEAKPSWDVTPGGSVVTSPGDRYEVVEWGPDGDTLRVIQRASRPRPIPAAERTDSARAFQARLDSIPVPLDEVNGMSDMARSRSLPEVLPEVLAVQVDAGGNLWLRRWPPDGVGGETFFDVLDATGGLLATVRIPAVLRSDPAPWVSDSLVVGVVADPITDVERVVVFRVRLAGTP